jgi:hypothetical protein
VGPPEPFNDLPPGGVPKNGRLAVSDGAAGGPCIDAFAGRPLDPLLGALLRPREPGYYRGTVTVHYIEPR